MSGYSYLNVTPDPSNGERVIITTQGITHLSSNEDAYKRIEQFKEELTRILDENATKIIRLDHQGNPLKELILSEAFIRATENRQYEYDGSSNFQAYREAVAEIRDSFLSEPYSPYNTKDIQLNLHKKAVFGWEAIQKKHSFSLKKDKFLHDLHRTFDGIVSAIKEIPTQKSRDKISTLIFGIQRDKSFTYAFYYTKALFGFTVNQDPTRTEWFGAFKKSNISKFFAWPFGFIGLFLKTKRNKSKTIINPKDNAQRSDFFSYDFLSPIVVAALMAALIETDILSLTSDTTWLIIVASLFPMMTYATSNKDYTRNLLFGLILASWILFPTLVATGYLPIPLWAGLLIPILMAPQIPANFAGKILNTKDNTPYYAAFAAVAGSALLFAMNIAPAEIFLTVLIMPIVSLVQHVMDSKSATEQTPPMSRAISSASGPSRRPTRQPTSVVPSRQPTLDYSNAVSGGVSREESPLLPLVREKESDAVELTTIRPLGNSLLSSLPPLPQSTSFATSPPQLPEVPQRTADHNPPLPPLPLTGPTGPTE